MGWANIKRRHFLWTQQDKKESTDYLENDLLQYWQTSQHHLRERGRSVNRSLKEKGLRNCGEAILQSEPVVIQVEIENKRGIKILLDDQSVENLRDRLGE